MSERDERGLAEELAEDPEYVDMSEAEYWRIAFDLASMLHWDSMSRTHKVRAAGIAASANKRTRSADDAVRAALGVLITSRRLPDDPRRLVSAITSVHYIDRKTVSPALRRLVDELPEHFREYWSRPPRPRNRS